MTATSTMPKRSVFGSSGVKYHRLERVGSDGFVDLQFEKPPPKIPYKAIILATVLFLGGTILIVVGALLLSGYIRLSYKHGIPNTCFLYKYTYSDRTWPLLILGSIMFIPGAYHVRLACYAYKGYTGYSYEDIPEFD
ncbi:transmembrane protein 230-like [Liolophura sinensis]|uniref:transmembrane protein 230-like n=1 Tax=Liolophura sinensis TaxID=3198878 RepID=UPI003158207E